jgi:Heavy metal associated domain 2
MIPSAFVSHHVPGRARISIPSRKGNGAYFESVTKAFSDVPCFERIEANIRTGSVLFMGGKISLEAISAEASSRGLFQLHVIKKDSGPAGLQQRVSDSFKNMNRAFTQFTGGELDIAGLAFLALVGAGIYEIGRGNFTAPAWYTVFWYALNIFLKSSKDTG